MSSVEDYYRQMGVVHDSDCLICTFEARSEARRGLLRRLWAKSYAPWVLIGLLLAAAYYVACMEIYNIVGGWSN